MNNKFGSPSGGKGLGIVGTISRVTPNHPRSPNKARNLVPLSQTLAPGMVAAAAQPSYKSNLHSSPRRANPMQGSPLTT